MKLPPKYSDFQLQNILEISPEQPENLNENNFLNDIQGNTKIKWRVNHFLFERKLLVFILDNSTFNKWKILKSLNWLIVFFILGFTIWTEDKRILLFLIIFPFLIVTFDHWIFIFNMTVIIALRLFSLLHIPYFWFFIITITMGYLLNKATDEMIEKKILKEGLNDWITFWKYYSSHMIWIDKSVLNNEYEILTNKYPELRTF